MILPRIWGNPRSDRQTRCPQQSIAIDRERERSFSLSSAAFGMAHGIKIRPFVNVVVIILVFFGNVKLKGRCAFVKTAQKYFVTVL